MSAFPYLRWYPGDFRSKTLRLSFHEKAAYRELIDECWLVGKVPVDDDLRMARIVGLDIRTWQRIKPVVLSFFNADGTQNRVEEERLVASKRAEVAANNGARGGRPKSLKTNDVKNPAGLQNETQTKALHSSSSALEREEKKESKKDYRRGSRLPDDFAMPEEWRQAAISNGLSADLVDREITKFCNFWQSKSGKDATKLDWRKTWSNWMLNVRAPRQIQPFDRKEKRQPSKLEAFDLLGSMSDKWSHKQ